MDRWKRHVSLLLVFILLFSLAGCSSGTEETDATPEGPRMEPGTYTASAYGFMGIEPLTVSVTVDETSILDIEIDRGRESVPMINAIEKLMVPRILEHQSVAVDAITGATVSSMAVKQALTEALTEALVAGGSDPADITAFQKPEPKVTASEEIEVDVLVIGMGGSGCAAAMSAAEHMYAIDPDNVSVLAIDKAGKFGGTSAFCGEPMAVNAPRFKEEFNNGEDYMDGNALYRAWLEYTEGDCKEEILRLFLENSGDTIDWLYYEHGFEFNEPLTGFGPEDVYRCKYQYANIQNAEEGRVYRVDVNRSMNEMVDQYFHNLIADYEELGGKYMLETEAYELLYDEANNKVVGAKARGQDGTEYTIHAKAVILATGGFAGNG
ncbi:MAG: FAD-binding protein [Bacillota bacterium]|nr:FAD-binding protein [Bacillota bacterium]